MARFTAFLVVDDQGPWNQGRNWKIIEQPELEKGVEARNQISTRNSAKAKQVNIEDRKLKKKSA